MRFAVLVILVAVSLFAYPAVSVSSSTIECCGPWNATVQVLDTDGSPLISCPVRTVGITEEGGNARVVSEATYFTNSMGIASLFYSPKSPNERYRISINCGNVRHEQSVPVIEGLAGPLSFLPNIDVNAIDLGGIATAAAGGILLIAIAALAVTRGKVAFDVAARLGVRKKEEEAQDLEGEMAPRHYIMEHERKVMEAKKLARKHMRKEVRLNHEYLKRFE